MSKNCDNSTTEPQGYRITNNVCNDPELMRQLFTAARSGSKVVILEVVRLMPKFPIQFLPDALEVLCTHLTDAKIPPAGPPLSDPSVISMDTHSSLMALHGIVGAQPHIRSNKVLQQILVRAWEANGIVNWIRHFHKIVDLPELLMKSKKVMGKVVSYSLMTFAHLAGQHRSIVIDDESRLFEMVIENWYRGEDWYEQVSPDSADPSYMLTSSVALRAVIAAYGDRKDARDLILHRYAEQNINRICGEAINRLRWAVDAMPFNIEHFTAEISTICTLMGGSSPARLEQLRSLTCHPVQLALETKTEILPLAIKGVSLVVDNLKLSNTANGIAYIAATSTFSVILDILVSKIAISACIQALRFGFLESYVRCAIALPDIASRSSDGHTAMCYLLTAVITCQLVYYSVIYAAGDALKSLKAEHLEEINELKKTPCFYEHWMMFENVVFERMISKRLYERLCPSGPSQIQCSHCMKVDGKVALLKCAGCMTLYCSKACQTSAWKLGGHRIHFVEPDSDICSGLFLSRHDSEFLNALATADVRRHQNSLSGDVMAKCLQNKISIYDIAYTIHYAKQFSEPFIIIENAADLLANEDLDTSRSLHAHLTATDGSRQTLIRIITTTGANELHSATVTRYHLVPQSDLFGVPFKGRELNRHEVRMCASDSTGKLLRRTWDETDEVISRLEIGFRAEWSKEIDGRKVHLFDQIDRIITHLIERNWDLSDYVPSNNDPPSSSRRSRKKKCNHYT
ncbi:hypothetical protein DFH11DRAFT_647325 [Phellopilus nigrolimitatus]|nr:hypothetical protein DFH11DRAFT_647325 [Phellopilus nigrolimitatus]